MKLPQRKRSLAAFGAMTSMIDVVLFLLMFFVVTAGSGSKALFLPTPLAKQGGQGAVQAEPSEDALPELEVWLKLSLDAGTQQTVTEMNGTAYTSMTELKEQLRTLADLAADIPVYFETAPEVPLGDLVSLYDTCQAAGFEKINFVASARTP